MVNDKISAKEVIERIRTIAEKQILLKDPCKTCGSGVDEIIESNKKMIDDVDILRNMYKNKLSTIKIKDFTYSIDDVNAMIERDKCYMQKSWEKYKICCKEGKLPSNGRFGRFRC